MATIAFDTFKFIKTLTQSGMPEEQASAISAAVGAIHETADLATKADLREVETAIRHDMEKMEARIDAKIDSLEQRVNAGIDAVEAKIELLGKNMVIKLGSLLVIGFGVLGVMIKLLP